MKANELRIGNYLYRNGLMEVRVISSGSLKIFDHYNNVYNPRFFDISSFIPIPIDELWLEKAGMKRAGLGGNRFIHKNPINKGGDLFIIETDLINFYPQINFDVCSFAEFKYVHQLQNLYFALTGEELKINKS